MSGAGLWIDPTRMSGAVCVTGTRIDTATIANLAWWHGVNEVRTSFEELTDYQIMCAMWWEWRYEDGRTKRGRWVQGVGGHLLGRPDKITEHLDAAPRSTGNGLA